MSKPRRKRHIPLNVVKPTSKRVRVHHVKASIHTNETLDQDTEAQDGYDGDIDELDLADISTVKISSSLSHQKRKEKQAERWSEIQRGVLRVVIEEMSPPEKVKCSICNDLCESIVRCTDCGYQFYCEECCIKVHTNTLYHHCPEIWRDGYYMVFPMPSPLLFNQFHSCDNDLIERTVTSFCISGVPHQIRFGVCQCESDSLTMIRLRYWPATPSRPTIAFSFKLMDWLEALLLECQTAIQDMTQALSYVLKARIDKLPCNLYPVLIDSFEEYRHFKAKLKAQISIDSSASMCPACPKESGTITVSLDALFGLCRKISAGKSVREPLSGTSVFEEQSAVDAFVDSYNPKEKSLESNECNNFLAGHALRSKSRYKALDETAVMGTVCRHEVPLRFFSLRHGERIGYALYMMKCLKERFPGHNIQLLYDIACTLDKHIKANEGFCELELAIPVFHCYGHKFQCQIQYGPRNKNGFGLSDGEGMERLWSYLRRFGRMTKEMRPSHRIDVLTDGILYYAKKAISNLGKTMANRMKRAHLLKQEAETKLECLASTSAEPFNREEVKMWLVERNEQFSQPKDDSSTYHAVPTWKEKYVSYIDAYIKIRDTANARPDDSAYATKLNRMEERLATIEIEHSITSRWLPDTIQYTGVRSLLESRNKHLILKKLRKLVRERWYLLALKAKYADGLAIATRLARRITSLTSQIKSSISQYNCGVMDQSEQLRWEAVIKLPISEPSCELFPTSSSLVPAEVRRQAVDHLTQISRSTEEIERLTEEMSNCIKHFKNLIDQYKAELSTMSSNLVGYDRFVLGSTCLMKKHVQQLHEILHEFAIAFSQWLDDSLLTECHLPPTQPQTSPNPNELSESWSHTHSKDPYILGHQSCSRSLIREPESTQLPRMVQMSTPSSHESHEDQDIATVSVREPEKMSSTPSSESESSDSDEENNILNPVQKWHGKMFLREEYINTQCETHALRLTSSDMLLLEKLDRSAESGPSHASGTSGFLARMKHFTSK